MENIKFKTILKENMSKSKPQSNRLIAILWLLFDTLTAMVGYTMHGSIFYSIINFIFAPFAWVYWLITHNVDMNVLRETFSWFFN